MIKTPTFDARRRWLLQSGASCASALGFGSVGNLLLGTQQAHAADYKALVCVFLYGGNDGLNTVVPTDAARYAQYSAVRGELAIPRASLVSLPSLISFNERSSNSLVFRPMVARVESRIGPRRTVGTPSLSIKGFRPLSM